jgi:iron complex transport system substrate-binding protein
MYIKRNFARDLTIESIANAINYSPSHVSRLFKDELNMTIFDYITEVRISKSKELLERTDLQVVAVAEVVGYKDSAYFSRIFKKRVGISPSEYRRWWQER